MNISSVGQYAYAGVAMDAPVTKGHHGSRCGCDGEVAASAVSSGSPESREVRGESAEHAQRHHHGHGEGHGRHGHGFGFGHYAKGMGNYIAEQLRAARREVIGEQIGEAAAGLTEEVAGLIGASGQQDGLAAAQEAFNTAIQDTVERFSAGEIGRRRTMEEFSSAYGELVKAVSAAPAGDVAEAGESAEAVAADADDTTGQADATAADAATANGSLAQSLGGVFNDFMQGLRSDFADAPGIRELMSPENRGRILEAFVGLYRELSGADNGVADAPAASGTVDQLV